MKVILPMIDMGQKILVVDDDRGILEAIQTVLDMEGYIVEICIDADKAMEKVFSFSPHLIILDVYLSGTDGRDIAQKIRSQKATQHIPIVMLSADPSVAPTVKHYGASDFLHKPFDIDHLLTHVEQFVN